MIKHICIILILTMSVSKISAQTALQLKFINDPKDTINKELKERYAIKQQLVKLKAAINTSNKQQFLALVTMDSKKTDINTQFYYADSLELAKITPWKRAIILGGRLEYLVDSSKIIKSLSAFNIDYYYNGLNKRKPLVYDDNKLFEEISIHNNIGTFDNMRFKKEGNTWKLNYADMINSTMRDIMTSKISQFLNDEIHDPSINAELINSEIIGYLEREYKVKLSSTIWKPLKSKSVVQIRK